MDPSFRRAAGRVVSSLPPGSSLARWIICVAKANGNASAAAEIAQKNYSDSPQVEAACRLFLQPSSKREIDEFIHHKAAIGPATTTDPTWAAPLAQFGIAQEFLQLLSSVSIFGRLPE